MLPQLHMIERVREICEQDTSVVGALMFGSFAVGEGDQFSDIEFALFFSDESFLSIDRRAWACQIAPLELFFADEFGHYTAIFKNLIRGEFHFEPAARMSIIESWQGYAWFPSAESAILVDRTGMLRQYLRPMIGSPPVRNTPATVTALSANFINLMLFGANIMARGELARAWALLATAHRHLLKLIRLDEGTTAHWPTPSKGLEKDLSEQAYERYRACTADLDPAALRLAYRETWMWGHELMVALAQRTGVDLPGELLVAMTKRFA